VKKAMPTYEYECQVCGHKFEILQKMTDKPIDQCPECGKKVRRLFGAGSGIIFKGSGFYETDYKKKSAPPQDKCKSDTPECANCPAKKKKEK